MESTKNDPVTPSAYRRLADEAATIEETILFSRTAEIGEAVAAMEQEMADGIFPAEAIRNLRVRLDQTLVRLELAAEAWEDAH